MRANQMMKQIKKFRSKENQVKEWMISIEIWQVENNFESQIIYYYINIKTLTIEIIIISNMI